MMQRKGNIHIIYVVFRFFCLVSFFNMTFYILSSGRFWKGPDGKIRNCYPVVLSFQVDYPEACLLTLVRQNQACPICMARKEDFANLSKKHPDRTVEEMSYIYHSARRLEMQGDAKAAEELLQINGLVNVEVC